MKRESPLTFWQDALWQQYGAAMEMLDNAVRACPDSVWGDRSLKPEFWYTTYHTLFWFDYYLSYPSKGFAPPAPFNLDEMDPRGLLPERVYTQQEILDYLEHCRSKCRKTIAALTDDKARERLTRRHDEFGRLELLLYNMRHIQHHVGQLNMHLRQTIDSSPGWVSKAKMPLVD